jgi:Utp14 protein
MVAVAGLDGTDQQVRQTAKTKNGILEMKFMRDAEERGYRVADRMADDFRAELVGMTADGVDVVESEGDGPSALEAVQGNQGRLIFRPTADQVRIAFFNVLLNSPPHILVPERGSIKSYACRSHQIKRIRHV